MLDQGRYASSMTPEATRALLWNPSGKGLHLLHVKIKLGVLGPFQTQLVTQVSILLDELCDAEAASRTCKSVFVHTWTGVI